MGFSDLFLAFSLVISLDTIVRWYWEHKKWANECSEIRDELALMLNDIDAHSRRLNCIEDEFARATFGKAKFEVVDVDLPECEVSNEKSNNGGITGGSWLFFDGGSDMAVSV